MADFQSTQPIYYQLVQKICRQIVRGDLLAGSKMASIRELAVQFGVNPNTIQRVNMELERLNLIETKRGQGTFITENQERLSELRKQLMIEQISNFIRDMKEMGFKLNEIIEEVEKQFQTEK